MTIRPSILLVDDYPDMLYNLSLPLEIAGFQTSTASNGIEALDILKTQTIDLILSDIVMPDMDGYQLFHQVRENSAWINIPFLFITGCLLDSEIRYGKELGVDDYLVKPVKTDHLLSAVRGKLKRQQQLINRHKSIS
ncbi:MAG TPA: response regulator [Anaerolineae bacterium]|nr:response regulator [Anaerolineae bacterium]MCB9107653.1 response regulator [Anaerolineales bacterium]HRV92738.1 response regulator [Anaerolineae bacterium]